MGTEFFDDDLLQSPDHKSKSSDIMSHSSTRPISEAGLSRLMRQKEDMTNQMTGAVKEIEHLKMKQMDLEKEKNELESLARKQDDYHKNKLEVIEKITKSLILIEKDEASAARMAELLSVMRAKFKDTLDELQKIDEGAWTDDNFQMEMNKAQVLVDDARGLYKKAMAKIDAAGWRNESMETKAETTSISMLSGSGDTADLKALTRMGFAFSMPLMAFLLVIFVLWLLATGNLFG